MDMSGQHQQVDADFRRKHADLLQVGQRSTDAMSQGLLAGDELQVGTLGSDARVDRGGDRGVDPEDVSQGVSEGGA